MSDGLSRGTMAVCPVCGGRFRRRQRGQKMCSKRCAGIHVARCAGGKRGGAVEYREEKTCVGCGKRFVATHSRQRYCSPLCRNKKKPPQKIPVYLPERCCEECGQVFSPVSEQQIYCNRNCAARASTRKYREALAAPKETVKIRITTTPACLLPEICPTVGMVYTAERMMENKQGRRAYRIPELGKLGLIVYESECQEVRDTEG